MIYGRLVLVQVDKERLMSSKRRQLARPPINEVACGFIFEPTTLDVLDFGVYAERRRTDFPIRELKPALADNPTVTVGFVGSGLRAWLISEDEEFVLQLQSDRLYLNWRRRAGQYPRFSAHAGRAGLKTKALQEFEQFGGFVEEKTGASLKLQRAELTKVDLLKRGKHYTDSADLGELLGVAKVFEDIAASDEAQLRLQLNESSEDGRLSVVVATTGEGVRVNTRYLFTAESDLAEAFNVANRRVNEVFFGLVSTGRFGVLGERDD